MPSASASFVQIQAAAADQRQQALAVVKSAVRSGHPELNFLALALQGKVDFSKVIKMCESWPALHTVYLNIFISRKVRLYVVDLEGQFQASLHANILKSRIY